MPKSISVDSVTDILKKTKWLKGYVVHTPHLSVFEAAPAHRGEGKAATSSVSTRGALPKYMQQTSHPPRAFSICANPRAKDIRRGVAAVLVEKFLNDLVAADGLLLALGENALPKTFTKIERLAKGWRREMRRNLKHSMASSLASVRWLPASKKRKEE
jgi:hypothetical protein